MQEAKITLYKRGRRRQRRRSWRGSSSLGSERWGCRPAALWSAFVASVCVCLYTNEKGRSELRPFVLLRSARLLHHRINLVLILHAELHKKEQQKTHTKE